MSGTSAMDLRQISFVFTPQVFTFQISAMSPYLLPPPDRASAWDPYWYSELCSGPRHQPVPQRLTHAIGSLVLASPAVHLRAASLILFTDLYCSVHTCDEI